MKSRTPSFITELPLKPHRQTKPRYLYVWIQEGSCIMHVWGKHWSGLHLSSNQKSIRQSRNSRKPLTVNIIQNEQKHSKHSIRKKGSPIMLFNIMQQE